MKRFGQKEIDLFSRIFPFWAPRVKKWEWKGFRRIRIYLTDGNEFLFIRKKGDFKLVSLRHGGLVVYDSSKDNRQGL